MMTSYLLGSSLFVGVALKLSTLILVLYYVKYVGNIIRVSIQIRLRDATILLAEILDAVDLSRCGRCTEKSHQQQTFYSVPLLGRLNAKRAPKFYGTVLAPQVIE